MESATATNERDEQILMGSKTTNERFVDQRIDNRELPIESLVLRTPNNVNTDGRSEREREREYAPLVTALARVRRSACRDETHSLSSAHTLARMTRRRFMKHRDLHMSNTCMYAQVQENYRSTAGERGEEGKERSTDHASRTNRSGSLFYIFFSGNSWK